MSARRLLPVLAAVVAATATALATGTPTAGAAGGWWVETNPVTPDSQLNVTGAPFTGTDAAGHVRGLIDAHTHMFSNDGFGGNTVCGAPFSPAGVAAALTDCPSHQPNGSTALVENLTNASTGGNPIATHDTVGWPTFRDWPAYDSFTHQQMYYKWVERAWRGGERIMVNDLVSNTGMCDIQSVVAAPSKYTCDDMDSVRREAADTYALQAYVDAQYGGPGKGWFRVVTTPQQATDVVKAGKLAVVLGIEVSEPFGCKQVLGIAQCSKADIDRGLDEVKALGVSSMFLCHKFDNALCGVRFDEGTTGLIVNVGQFLTTGTWWDARPCQPGQVPDHPVIGGVLPPSLYAVLPPGTVAPVYPSGPVCNPKGLTDLGEYALKGMIKRGMMVEVDHMSGKAAGQALSIMEAAGYPGALSSHSWMADEYMDRLYAMGGFAAQYGHNATDFVADWQKARPLLAKYGKGYGYGMDMNGFGGTPAPPAAGAGISYPFTSIDGGSTIDRQLTGQRTFDYDVDGVAQYGQIPDWVQNLTQLGGPELASDLLGGAQSYLDTWTATRGYQPPVDLALGRPATASSTEWTLFGTLTPARAVDGNDTTRWASAWSDDQWLRVDLGATRSVGRVAARWEAAYAKAWSVEVSTDGTHWTTAWSTTAGQGGLETARFTPVDARYVRIHGTKRATAYGYSLYTVNVFGP